jgi:hypothetical protein
LKKKQQNSSFMKKPKIFSLLPAAQNELAFESISLFPVAVG